MTAEAFQAGARDIVGFECPALAQETLSARMGLGLRPLLRVTDGMAAGELSG